MPDRGLAGSTADTPPLPMAPYQVAQATRVATSPGTAARAYKAKDAEEELRSILAGIETGADRYEWNIPRLEDFLNTKLPRVKGATPEEQQRLKQIEETARNKAEQQQRACDQAFKQDTSNLLYRATELVRQQQFDQALRVFEGYSGNLPNTTARWRSEKADWVRMQWDTAKVLKEATSTVGVCLARHDLAAARREAANAMRNPKLAALSNETTAAAAFVERVSRYEDDILASFALDTGKVIRIKMKSGKTEEGRLDAVRGTSLQLTWEFEKGARGGKWFDVGEFHFDERKARLGASSTPEACARRALLFRADGNKSGARKALEDSPPHPLVAAMAVALQLDSTGPVNAKAVSTNSLPAQLSLDLGDGRNMEFVLVQPGSFAMGSGAGDAVEKPAHPATISAPFYLGKYEVTQDQWQQVMGNNPSNIKGTNLPVQRVSWDDCQTFLQRLKAKCAASLASLEGADCILPTEAQWEYACRADSTNAYSCGDDASCLIQYAWCNPGAGGQMHPVGEKKPNVWGLYDMHGNVWEWCQDRAGAYPNGAVTDPMGPLFESARVARGGSYGHDSRHCRSATRFFNAPSARCDDGGFRVVVVFTGSAARVASSNVKEIVSDAGSEVAAPSAKPATAMKGRFYTFIDDGVTVYVNSSNVFSAPFGLHYSEEITLNIGDLLQVEINNSWGARGFKLAFLTSDRRAVISFQAKDFKDMGLQPISDITAKTVRAATKRARQEKYEGMKDSLLPDGIKDRSDVVWGSKDRVVLGGFITKDLVSRIGR